MGYWGDMSLVQYLTIKMSNICKIYGLVIWNPPGKIFSKIEMKAFK